jgi:Flp pilus assembly protein TadB
MIMGLSVHVLSAILVGAGLFIAITSLRWPRTGRNLKRISALRRAADETLEVEAPEDDLMRLMRTRGLDVTLAQADLNVTPAGFTRTGILLILLGLAGGYLVSGGLLVALFTAAATGIMYVYWLQWRRDEKRLEYEEALADMCDRLSAGATLTSTLQGAMNHAAETAPAIVKEDFNYIASQLTQTASVKMAFGDVVKRRRSYSLALMADTLEVWALRGATISLQEVLAPLSSTIRAISMEGRRMNSELTRARWQLFIVAVAPAMFVLLLRLTTPAMDQMYASPTGQIVQIVAYSIAAAGFLLGQRTMQRVRRVMDIGQG